MDDASLADVLYDKSASPQPLTPASNASVASTLYDATPAPVSQPAAVDPPAESEPAQEDQPQAAAQEDSTPAPDAQDDAVEIQIPDNIKAERAADPARALYDQAAQFRETINHDALFSNPAVATQFERPVQNAAIKELANMAADVGMSNGDVRILQSVFKHVNEVPSEETRLQWREQAVQRLNETYGMQAKQAMADAVQFVKTDPRRLQLLEINGAGDHPDAVLLFARLARQARMQGKIK